MSATPSTQPAPPPPEQEPDNRWARRAQQALSHPLWTLPALLILVTGIEVAQVWPEILPGGHALGEVIRNLAYALIGAVIFHWVMVELPDRRRRRRAYAFADIDLQGLVILGLGLFHSPNLLAGRAGLPTATDAWDQHGIDACLQSLWSVPSAHGGDVWRQNRHGLLTTAVMGAQVALDGLARSAPHLDQDVAQALAQFPGTTGIHQLQMLPLNDPLMPQRDAHITWQLLEGARRLYTALLENAPYVDLKVEGMHVALSDGTKKFFSRDDLVRPVPKP